MRNRDAGQLIRAIRALPRAHAFKLVAHPGQEAGLPDVLAVVDGRVWALELKHARDRLSRWQERQRAALEAAGATYVVVGDGMTIEDVVGLFRSEKGD